MYHHVICSMHDINSKVDILALNTRQLANKQRLFKYLCFFSIIEDVSTITGYIASYVTRGTYNVTISNTRREGLSKTCIS
jgi:predicted component of viral defense system (DUF524 family)